MIVSLTINQRRWLLVFALAPFLGFCSSVDEYLRYAVAVRKKYQWAPEDDCASDANQVLQGFLEREGIFSLPDFRDRYERQARANHEAEIKRPGDP